MSLSPPKSHFALISFLTLILLTQSAPPLLLQSDHTAISLIIHKHLNNNPCDSPGIFCERRLAAANNSNSRHVLRITRLLFQSHHHHHLNGKLSPAIGQLSELKEISLPNNHLVGQIPPQIADCKKLQILNLTSNRFSGEIPPGLSSLIRLRVLDLSSNKLAGNLNFLKYFRNLEKLNLSDNMFVGKVPVNSLRSFRNLRIVDFSGNNLLDEGLFSFTNNQLEFIEKIDSNIPKRYVFAENSRNQSSSTHNHKKKKKNNKRKILGWSLGLLAGAIAGILSGLLFSILFKLLMLLIKGPNKDKGLRIFSPMIKNPDDLAFLEKEDGLASLSIIGKGGCGEVYKAVLPGSNGREIAIKKIVQISSRDAEELSEEDSKALNKKMRQVQSEIKTVGQIRHRNLLSLLAHLPRSDCHYLVYEYMKNGSLQDYLKQVPEGGKELDWMARYKIALGVASGLEYLHMSHNPRIIHRDLKPANILIDDEMEARIADFGLAKAVPEAHTHVTTSNVAGTVGYIAPEYYQTFKFTDKCDIYSFGVLLGVLVMGKMPSDEFFQHTDEMSLVKWMRNVMSSEDAKRAIDPVMLGNGYEEQMLLVLKVACFCTLDNPKERPDSKDARCMLSQIKH